jgi:hypothetical protein
LKKPNCRLPLEFSTRERDGKLAVVALTLGAQPDLIEFRAQKDGRTIYDSELTPKYAPYEIRRDDNPRFCGEQAYLEPSCVRGSPACKPFPVRCDACERPKVCCAWPDWGHEYGIDAATQCVSSALCQDRLGHVICQGDADCPAGLKCTDDSLRADYEPPIRACR